MEHMFRGLRLEGRLAFLQERIGASLNDEEHILLRRSLANPGAKREEEMQKLMKEMDTNRANQRSQGTRGTGPPGSTTTSHYT